MRRRSAPQTRAGVSGALALLLLGGCSGSEDHDVTLDVLVAASLADVVGKVADQFEADHPGVSVRLSSGGSSDLVAQAIAGAPADVVVTADERTMGTLTADDQVHADKPVVIATNTPVLITPGDDSGGVGSLAQAATSRLVVCAPQVPCGDAALRLAELEGVTLKPVSEESSVTDVLAKVVGGEADAGIVYATDARAAAKRDPQSVRVVRVPGSAAVVNRYPATAIDGDDAATARAFVKALTAKPAQAVLREAGFGAP